MSIRVIAPAPDGSAHMVHTTPELGEHFFVARVRRTANATLLPCHLCDAVTTIPRDLLNADHREVQALIDAGRVTPVVVADTAVLDPLVAGKEDADAGVTTPTASRHAIPAAVPQDTEGRKALRVTLTAAHHDRRPAGTRFHKWTSATTFEVHEDDGTGTTKLIETWDSDTKGRLSKR